MNHSNKERPIYKWTLVACSLIMIAYFATDARAETTEQDVAQLSAICYVTNVLTKHEDGLFWESFLVNWVGKDSAEIQIAIFGNNMANMSADELSVLSKQCSAAKLELEEYLEEE